MIIACLLVLPADAASPADLETARTVLAAREANRARFTHWSIRYECTVAKADDLENALARRWSDDTEHWKDPAIGTGFSAYDGKRGRDELLFSIKDLAEKRSREPGGNYSTILFPQRLLTVGRAAFWDRIDVDTEGKSLEHKPYINFSNERFYLSFVLPLGLGRLPRHEGDSLATEIQDVLDGKPGHSMTIHEGVRLFDRDLIELAFTDTSHSPDVNTSRYWVDLEQGGITRKSEQTFHHPEVPESVQYAIQNDIRRVGDAAWFPYRFLTYDKTSRVVRDRRITEADFANVPPRSTFHLTFDTPTKVSDLSRSITYPARTVWDLEYLPQPEPPPKQRRRQPSRWARTRNFLAAHGRSIVGIVLIAIPAVMAVRLILKRNNNV